MKEFFVGLLVILTILLLSIVGTLLMPFIVVLGFLLKWVILFVLVIVGVWVIGRVTLKAMEHLKKKER